MKTKSTLAKIGAFLAGILILGTMKAIFGGDSLEDRMAHQDFTRDAAKFEALHPQRSSETKEEYFKRFQESRGK
jgi:hypothetical protein